MSDEHEERWSDLPEDMRAALKKSARNILFWQLASEKVGGLKVIVVSIGAIVAYATGFLDFLLGALMDARSR